MEETATATPVWQWRPTTFTEVHYDEAMRIWRGVRYWRETFSIHNLFSCDQNSSCPCKTFFNHEKWKAVFGPFTTKVHWWLDSLRQHLDHPTVGEFMIDDTESTFEAFRHEYRNLTTLIYEHLVCHAENQRARIMRELCRECEKKSEKIHSEALKLLSFNTPTTYDLR